MIKLISARTMVLLCLALVVVQILLAALALGSVQNKVLYLAALALYPAAIAVALGPVRRRIPTWRAWVVLLYTVFINAVVPWTLHAEAWDGYALWNLSSSYTLLVILVLRERAALAWLGVLVEVVTIVWWSAPGPAGIVGGLLFNTATIGWVAVAGGIAHLLDSSDRKVAQYTADATSAATRQGSDLALNASRTEWIRHVQEVSGGMLARIADDSHVLGEEDKREMRMLEARLRDEIRGRALATERILESAGWARERGVEVQLLDDRNEDLDPGFLERVTDAVLEVLETAAAGEVTVRVRPAGKHATVSILSRTPGNDAEPMLQELVDRQVVTETQ